MRIIKYVIMISNFWLIVYLLILIFYLNFCLTLFFCAFSFFLAFLANLLSRLAFHFSNLGGRSRPITSSSETCKIMAASGKRPDSCKYFTSSDVRGKPSRMNPVDLEQNRFSLKPVKFHLQNPGEKFSNLEEPVW